MAYLLILTVLAFGSETVFAAPAPEDLSRSLLREEFYATATPAQLRSLLGGASLSLDGMRTRDNVTPLMLAARNTAYPEVIDILVRAGCAVNARGDYRNSFYRFPNTDETEDISTALHFAVLNPKPAALGALLRHKPDLDARAAAPCNYSALELAVRRPERTEHLRLLLQAGARPKPGPKATKYSIWRFFLGYYRGGFYNQDDPLAGMNYARGLYLSPKEAADKTKLLLAHGVLPDADALGRALAAGQNEAARLLLAAGVDPSAAINGKSMLFHALYRPSATENSGYGPIDAPSPDTVLVRRLLQASKTLPNREELLSRACKSGLPAAVVRLLVEAGAPYSTRDNGLIFDALHSVNDCADLVEYLLSLGFSPIQEKNNNRGNSPLYAAREFPRQKPRCALALVKAGADPKELMGGLDRKFAMKAGILDAEGKVLVQAGPVSQAEQKRQGLQRDRILAKARQDPWNALFSPIFYKEASPEDVAAMIAASGRRSLAGVRVEKEEIPVNYFGSQASPGNILLLPVLVFKKDFWTGKKTLSYEYTPLDEAAGATPYPEVIHMLVKAGCDARDMGSRALLSALFNPEPKVLEALLRYKPDLRASIFYLGTPLHKLAGEDAALFKKEHFRLLLAAGADVNALYGQDRETPLMKAAFSGNTEAARMLLEAGAQTGIRNRVGKSALDMAVSREAQAIVRLLQDSGTGATR